MLVENQKASSNLFEVNNLFAKLVYNKNANKTRIQHSFEVDNLFTLLILIENKQMMILVFSKGQIVPAMSRPDTGFC